jgi:hypothetical protein
MVAVSFRFVSRVVNDFSSLVCCLCWIVENACNLALTPKESASPAGLTQILALVQRSDTVAIKSEGTRVLVNVIKSLWSSDTSPDTSMQKRRQQTIQSVLVPASAETLASLIGRSMKYPLLVNEGVVALTLLSTHKDGGRLLFGGEQYMVDV